MPGLERGCPLALLTVHIRHPPAPRPPEDGIDLGTVRAVGPTAHPDRPGRADDAAPCCAQCPIRLLVICSRRCGVWSPAPPSRWTTTPRCGAHRRPQPCRKAKPQVREVALITLGPVAPSRRADPVLNRRRGSAESPWTRTADDANRWINFSPAAPDHVCAAGARHRGRSPLGPPGRLRAAGVVKIEEMWSAAAEPTSSLQVPWPAALTRPSGRSKARSLPSTSPRTKTSDRMHTTGKPPPPNRPLTDPIDVTKSQTPIVSLTHGDRQ